MNEPRTTNFVVLVHPDDMNLADAKAEAARYNATIEGNRFVKRGTILVTTQAVLDFANRWQ